MRTDKLPRCGVVMKSGDVCARMDGHRWEHRSGYALDNQYRRKMGRERDPFVHRLGQWMER